MVKLILADIDFVAVSNVNHSKLYALFDVITPITLIPTFRPAANLWRANLPTFLHPITPIFQHKPSLQKAFHHAILKYPNYH